MSETPLDPLEFLNRRLGGYSAAMGVRFTQASVEGVMAEIDIGEQHLQPYGLVHGGVYTGLVETLCSVAAVLCVMPEGKSVVGLDNTTSFIRAVSSGTLRARSTPLHRGRRTHVWQCDIFDDHEQLVATGRLRLLVLDAGAAVAGGEITDGRWTADDRRPETEDGGRQKAGFPVSRLLFSVVRRRRSVV